MTVYSLLSLAHAGFGTIALLTFWTAGMARKGSPVHVVAGKGYLLAMVALLALALPMSLMIIARGGPGLAIGFFLLYLLVITITSVWLSWRAIRDKRDWARYTGPVYRALTWLNLAGALGIVVLGVFFARQMQLVIVSFSAIGFLGFFQMRRFARSAPTDPRWWLSEHMGAMLGNAAATHIAFLAVGLPRLVPALANPLWVNIAWLGPLAMVFVARAWLNRKYLPKRTPGPASPGRTTPLAAAP